MNENWVFQERNLMKRFIFWSSKVIRCTKAVFLRLLILVSKLIRWLFVLLAQSIVRYIIMRMFIRLANMYLMMVVKHLISLYTQRVWILVVLRLDMLKKVVLIRMAL